MRFNARLMQIGAMHSNAVRFHSNKTTLNSVKQRDLDPPTGGEPIGYG
jgi:hypothetical protein